MFTQSFTIGSQISYANARILDSVQFPNCSQTYIILTDITPTIVQNYVIILRTDYIIILRTAELV